MKENHTLFIKAMRHLINVFFSFSCSFILDEILFTPNKYLGTIKCHIVILKYLLLNHGSEL